MHQNRNLTMTLMKSSLVGTFLLLHLSSTVSGLGSVVSRNYSYIKIHYTWQEAQSYCRNDSHGDLAIIYNQSDIDYVNLTEYQAWIGLQGNQYNNGSWFSGTNLDFSVGDCPYVNSSSKKIGSADCESYYFFSCNRSDFTMESKTWYEAKNSCQANYSYQGNLNGSIHWLTNYSYQSNLNGNIHRQGFPVWIGLYREGETWKWSAGVSDYRNWTSGETMTNGDCVTISSDNKQMATQNCSSRFPFICYEDNVVLVKENKTWEEALEYCRALSSPPQPELRYELLSVQPEDYDYLRNRVMEADTEEVWTGLRFLAGEWLWVNGADMRYSDLPLCPSLVQRCGTLSKNGTGSMETRDCAERRNFLCYSV